MHTAEVLSSLSQHQKASCCHQLAYNSSITHLSHLEAKTLTSLSALLGRRAPRVSSDKAKVFFFSSSSSMTVPKPTCYSAFTTQKSHRITVKQFDYCLLH